MARPSKFQKKFTEDLIDFFSISPLERQLTGEVVEYYEDGQIKKENNRYQMVPAKIPTIRGFARKINVAYKTVYNWLKEGQIDDEPTTKQEEWFEEFLHAYKEAMELRKEFLINIGLSGASPPSAYIFTAKNLTDMTDEQTINNNHTISSILDEIEEAAKIRQSIDRSNMEDK